MSNTPLPGISMIFHLLIIFGVWSYRKTSSLALATDQYLGQLINKKEFELQFDTFKEEV